MPAGILLLAICVWLNLKRNCGFYLGVFVATLIVAVLLITLLVLVPIDNSINLDAVSVPQDFESIRTKWESYHAAQRFFRSQALPALQPLH
jgi:uncharacterized membrane protein